MEILKLSKKWGLRALLTITLSLLICLTATFGVGQVAFGNNSDIGSSGGSIEIADVTENKVSATFSNRDKGVKLKITLPLASSDVYFAFEVDSSEPVWAISGDALFSDEVPYIQHTGAVESFIAESTTIKDRVESSWSDVNVVYEKRVFYVETHYNGTLYVRCNMSGADEVLTATHLVKDIDNLAPTMEKSMVAHGKKNTDGKFVFEITATFSDNLVSNVLASAKSGLEQIIILRSDLELSSLDGENLDGTEQIALWELLSPLQALLNQKITFDLDKDGYYYYFVVDRVGNLNVGTLLDGKFERENYADTDDRFLVHDSSAGSTGATYSVKTLMTTIGQELDDYNGKISSKIYDDCFESYSALLLRFYSGASSSDIQGVSNEWFSFYKNEYTAFKNAYSIGATYDINIVNGDLLKGKLNVLNLNKENCPALAGDEVRANFIVAKYEFMDLDSALSIPYKSGYAYKLNYTLTQNGNLSNPPKEPLVYEILSLPKEVTDLKLMKKVGNEFVEVEIIKGTNWLRYEESLNQGEYYLILSTEKGADLLWLWITIPVVFVVGTTTGIFLFFYFKKRKIH